MFNANDSKIIAGLILIFKFQPDNVSLFSKCFMVSHLTQNKIQYVHTAADDLISLSSWPHCLSLLHSYSNWILLLAIPEPETLALTLEPLKWLFSVLNLFCSDISMPYFLSMFLSSNVTFPMNTVLITLFKLTSL